MGGDLINGMKNRNEKTKAGYKQKHTSVFSINESLCLRVVLEAAVKAVENETV